MKFPFDFSIKLIFRLLFPGAILAAAMAPAVHAVLHGAGVLIQLQYLYPFEVIGWGWLIVLCDMQIYMLFEGRRYWPRVLHTVFIRGQERRKDRLARIVSADEDDLEAAYDLGLYPIDDGGKPIVTAPTRLGNILDSFETYPEIKYGLDAIFFWYRLWVVIDKDLREEIDNAQSVVDSALYVAFALYASGLAMFAYAIIGLASHAGLPAWLARAHVPYVPEPGVLFGLGAACFVGGFLIYRLSLSAHAQFGELFKSLFDQYRTKLVFDDVLAEIGMIVGDPYLHSRPKRDQNWIVWRYLRWHRVRDEAEAKNYTLEEWGKRQAARQAAQVQERAGVQQAPVPASPSNQ